MASQMTSCEVRENDRSDAALGDIGACAMPEPTVEDQGCASWSCCGYGTFLFTGVSVSDVKGNECNLQS